MDTLPPELLCTISSHVCHGDDGTNIRSLGAVSSTFRRLLYESLWATISLRVRTTSKLQSLHEVLSTNPPSTTPLQHLFLDMSHSYSFNPQHLTPLFSFCSSTLVSLTVLRHVERPDSFAMPFKGLAFPQLRSLSLGSILLRDVVGSDSDSSSSPQFPALIRMDLYTPLTTTGDLPGTYFLRQTPLLRDITLTMPPSLEADSELSADGEKVRRTMMMFQFSLQHQFSTNHLRGLPTFGTSPNPPIISVRVAPEAEGGRYSVGNVGRVLKAYKWITDMKFIVVPNTEDLSVEWLRERWLRGIEEGMEL
ncbi:hypothetical protein DL96DRAFT_1588334 [Flagelloscypha sp. PMI_526]|nr:hypothetical protein DL96DRAFT_1588334 [Flagelloscypha sp. PMI_526]